MIRDGWFRGRKTTGFTLQWHLTNACPYQCRHCYDRLDRRELDLAQALAVVEDFRRFCRRHRVTPHVCLTGGDPLQYSHFWALYAAITKAEMRISILGNPISAARIERLMAIRPPDYYQVSLEGFEEHNDSIRGKGHFRRVMRFLEDARLLRLQTHVMLTLTQANVSHVVALGDFLRGRTPCFTFNRLSRVGNGAALALPTKEHYMRFLRSYLQSARHNPILRLKDNLFCLAVSDDSRHGKRSGMRGCTGHGCGAAFNFVALLPDGEIHACRKFPSLIGNLHTSNMEAIYRSEAARRYRVGPGGCAKCKHRQHCNGCMAVVYGCGLDPLRARDPFCFAEM
ncbi:MAG: thio(seleno)oxazole modification radical SAM maturase SbtM [Polyangiaceae bacterium]|nr:thio(seleno)oxazole modification radical SAM maturase SbtM [Polyangiaceae bacterium]